MSTLMSMCWGGTKPENLHPGGEILVRVLWIGSSKQMSHDVSPYFKKCQYCAFLSSWSSCIFTLWPCPSPREPITDGATVAETMNQKHGQLMQRKAEKKVFRVECVLREERAKHKDKPCCSAALGRAAGPWHVPVTGFRDQVGTGLQGNPSLLYFGLKRQKFSPSSDHMRFPPAGPQHLTQERRLTRRAARATHQ